MYLFKFYLENIFYIYLTENIWFINLNIMNNFAGYISSTF